MPTGIQLEINAMLCAICNDFTNEEATPYLETALCGLCVEAYIYECEGCGDSYLDTYALPRSAYMRGSYRRYLDEHDIQGSGMSFAEDVQERVCEDCCSSCSNCGTIYAVYDNAVDCCVEESCDTLYVRGYSYRPSFFYHSANNGVVNVYSSALPGLLYMGIEIEVEKMMILADNFYESLTPRQKDFMYMKTDGSLSSSGVELVTMPATLEAIKLSFPFSQLDTAREAGARSFYYNNCGFHIHVSRSAFTATHMWKFAKFQIENPLLCQSVGQRTSSSYASWHYEYGGSANLGDGLPSMVKGKSSNRDRYVAINFQPRETVELRYFKGNILTAAILKNVEFVQSMYDYTKNLSVKDVVVYHALKSDHYLEWLNENSESYPNLYTYIWNSSLVNQGE